MKKLQITKDTPVINNDFACEFCGVKFKRETTLARHACEPRRRWMDQHRPGNRIGFQCWIRFYQKNSLTSNTPKTYQEFIKSAYFLAFVKFGNYCASVNIFNSFAYTDWLLKNEIRIDTWCSDVHYTRFLVEYLKIEDSLDAVARSVETMINRAQEEGIQPHDYLRYGNRNKICHIITTGRISPWVLYQSKSGVSFLESLDETQQKMILDYINPEQWAIKFIRNKDELPNVKQLLQSAGY